VAKTSNPDLIRPKPTNKLGFLSSEQHKELCKWLLTPNLPYFEIVTLIEKHFGIETSVHSLQRFYRKYVSQYLISERRRNLGVATRLSKEVRQKPSQFNPATVDSLEQLAFKLSNEPDADVKKVQVIYELVLRAKEQELRRHESELKARRLDFLEQKAQDAEDALANSRLSETEFVERMREIFKPDEPNTNGTRNGHARAKGTETETCIPS